MERSAIMVLEKVFACASHIWACSSVATADSKSGPIWSWRCTQFGGRFFQWPGRSNFKQEIIRLADLDADGYMDALVTFDETGNFMTGSAFSMDPKHNIPLVDSFATGARPRDAVIADFNKDGLLDFALPVT